MAEFKHFSIVAGGDLVDGHDVPDAEVGPSVVSMKVWAESVEQAVDVFCEIGNHIGFKIDQNVEVHRTPAQQPVREQPFGYEVRVLGCTEETRDSLAKEEAEALRAE